jgi:hypothetical protein
MGGDAKGKIVLSLLDKLEWMEVVNKKCAIFVGQGGQK